MTKPRFEIHDTPLAGLTVLQRLPRADSRGYFEQMFGAGESLPYDKQITQINHSFTAVRGTVRGLHYQTPPHADLKLVSCLQGEVFDVAVDLRPASPTFFYWHGEVLSAANHRTLLIPEGFAHGFQTLTDDCELLYLHTVGYHPEFERGIHVRDPRVPVAWPLAISLLSERDAAFPFLTEDFAGVSL